ncbi:MAG: hypothetical protein IT580_09085 [Verrucomicrobiales bacterium]|nr:hypothetical protein [Verrucomicrobiales bacterium]
MIRTLTGLALAGWVLVSGCGSPLPNTIEILSDPVSVVATSTFEEQIGMYQLRVAHGDRDWTLRSFVPGAGRSGGLDAAALAIALQQRVVWQAPYLFVRESHEERRGWRSTVDHVFKLGSAGLQRVGTVAADTATPGSQLRDGRFRDVYDRLEFTFLTSRPQAPRFTLVMLERDSRFEVDPEATWREGESDFRERLRELEHLAQRAEPLTAERDQRHARGLALFCLAFSRYCERDTEFAAAEAGARKVLEDFESLLAEAQTVRPRELAPSSEEVFRANPALLNLFGESPAPRTSEPASSEARPIAPTGIGLTPL